MLANKKKIELLQVYMYGRQPKVPIPSVITLAVDLDVKYPNEIQ